MKSLSERTRMLINELQALTVGDTNTTNHLSQSGVDKAIELINQIVECGQWPSIIYLAPYVADPVLAIAESASNGIEVLQASMRRSLLLQLDDRFRGGCYSVPNFLNRWDKADYSSLERPSSKKTQVGVMGIASFHRNGHVREAAVRRLSGMTQGNELPFLLIRLSDWVPQVRSAAELAVDLRIAPDYLHHFVDNLALLERVKQRKRDAGAAKRIELTEKVTSQLQQSENRKLLLDALLHPDYEVRRVCLKLLIDSKASGLAEIIERLIRDRDVTNRRAVIELSNDLSSSDQLVLLKRLVKDRAPSIRRKALGALCEINSDEELVYLEATLTDSSAMLRDNARWRLTKLETSIDFRNFYLERLKSGSTAQLVAVAAAGLGETGKPEDALVLVPFVDHQKPQIKRAAIKSIARLDSRNYIQLFLRLLVNDSPGVSRAAADALEQTLSLVPSNALWTILTTTSHSHVKRNILRLLNHTSKWERIGYLLLAISENDKRLREIALENIDSWNRQYHTTWQYTRPTIEQHERFVTAFRGVSNTLPERVRNTLEQCTSFA